MKPIHVIGIILAVAFAIVWCFQIWSAGQWKTTLQGEGSGNFYEQRDRRAGAQAFVREAFGDSPTPADQATDMSGLPWEDRLGKIIDHWVRVIKSTGHGSRRAPSGVYFTLTYFSVRNGSGLTGVNAGTQVVCVKDEGPVLRVKTGNLEFEAKRQYLTNDLDVADLAVRDDAEAQQALALYIAQQQQAIEQQSEKRKMQPSAQH
jgi:hypothetical protein